MTKNQLIDVIFFQMVHSDQILRDCTGVGELVGQNPDDFLIFWNTAFPNLVHFILKSYSILPELPEYEMKACKALVSLYEK